jgi:tyrosyl-tRNA synthetase
MNNLKEYISNFSKIEGIQIINLERFSIDSNTPIYCGFQVSGVPHIGSWIYFLVLDYISRYFNMDCMVLLADIHTLLNNKIEVQKIQEQFTRTFPDTKVKFILGSEFQLSKSYISHMLKFSKNVSITRLYKSLDLTSRLKRSKNKLNILLYPYLQILDIDFLKVGLVLSGIDQRRIHMLHVDTSERKPIFIHFPLLKGVKTQSKMSKSLENTIPLGCSKSEFDTKWTHLDRGTKSLFLKMLEIIRPDLNTPDLISRIYGAS